MKRADGRISKTMVFSYALAVAGAIQVTLPQLRLPEEYQGIATMVVGILVAVLRVVTTQPLDPGR